MRSVDLILGNAAAKSCSCQECSLRKDPDPDAVARFDLGGMMAQSSLPNGWLERKKMRPDLEEHPAPCIC